MEQPEQNQSAPLTVDASVNVEAKIQADVTEGANHILNGVGSILKETATAIGVIPSVIHNAANLALEEWRYRQDGRRARNLTSALAIAAPDINEDAVTPDSDWLSEWLDLAGKRSHADWQKAFGKMLAMESNSKGSIPLRFFADMARLDQDVIDEFKLYCGYYLPALRMIAKQSHEEPWLLSEANLIKFHGPVTQCAQSVTKRGNVQYQVIPVPIPMGYILIKNDNYSLPCGNVHLTHFGRLIYSLLDPKPLPAIDLMESLRAMWKDYLYEEQIE